MSYNKLLTKFLKWRIKNLSAKQFINILSVFAGLAAGLAAFLIKNAVHEIRLFLTSSFSQDYQNYLYILYPAIGLLLTVIFMRYILKHHVEHGIPSVLHAISKTKGRMKPHNMCSSIITSALTVGFGGSVGLEGPTVATGAAVGSNIGRFFHLNYKQSILLLGAASAAAMSAIFKAPIAAVVFAIEVIMIDLTTASLVPLLIASATAAITSFLLLGKDVLYSFSITEPFLFKDIPYYLILGVLSGFLASYFTRVYMFVNKIFDNIKSWYKKIIIGGVVLGVLIFLFPSLYGEGYDAINSTLHGDFSYLYNNSIYYSFKDNIYVIFGLFIALILLKVIATSATFGAGGVGGIFAPTLFLGSNLGLFFAVILNHYSIATLSLNNFALAGMAGLIAGVLQAPLTGIFLIAEITDGYGMFMPLMITATISYATVKIFEENNVYSIQLAKRGELFTHHKDKAILSMMQMDKLLETNFSTITSNATLGDLVKVISKSVRNIFPVVDKDNNFKGVVVMDDVRDIMFDHTQYDKTKVRDLMFVPHDFVTPHDTMEHIANIFHKTGNYNLPVIEDGKYLGFISRANLFSTYRRLLKSFSDH
ncbi:MAG: chloride channel protein [Bacteroidetes bacterium]|nr:MAG: chloride channel protein [Bacteroidota bacterium]